MFGDCLSETITPTSGISKHSILSPLPLVTFIDDLLDSLFCKNLRFADDFKIYKQMQVIDDWELSSTAIWHLEAEQPVPIEWFKFEHKEMLS